MGAFTRMPLSCIKRRTLLIITTPNAVILSAAKDLLADNQTMVETKNSDLESNLTLLFGVDCLNVTHLR